jgi:molecular chaperone GrpE
MKPLTQKIKEIVSAGLNAKDKYLGDLKIEIDWISLHTNTSSEYDFYCEEASKISENHNESSEGIRFHLDSVRGGELGVRVVMVKKPSDNSSKSDTVNFTSGNTSELKSHNNLKEVSNGIFELTAESLEVDIIITLNDKSSSQGVANQQADNLSELELQLTEEKGKRLQLMADFQNFQRRVEAERATWGAMSNMSIIQDLLEVSDDIQLALQDTDLNLESSKISLKSAQDKLVSAAQSAGIEKVEVNIGDEFDKEKMEAVSTVPSPENAGKVIAVITSAYKYTNKEGILKPAKVVVGK